VIVLDFHFWLPGWAEPTEAEWREKQNTLLAGDGWIADGNYTATLDLRLKRADTVVFLDMPWWMCARRAFVRGLRSRPIDFELPGGCDQSRFRQLRDEWWLVWRIWRVHRSEREGKCPDPPLGGSWTFSRRAIVQVYFPVFEWGDNVIGGLHVRAQPLRGPPFRVLGIQHIADVIHLDHVGENRVDTL